MLIGQVAIKWQGWLVYTLNLSSTSKDKLQIQSDYAESQISMEKSREKYEQYNFLKNTSWKRGIAIMTLSVGSHNPDSDSLDNMIGKIH